LRPPRRAAAAVLLVLPLLLFMSTEEGGKTSATMDFIGKTVNFLILFGGLAFLLRKPLAAMLAKRSAGIQETIRLADAGKADAERKHGDSEARLYELEDEVRRMMATAEGVAQGERERIAQLAAEEARRVRRFAEQEIDEQLRTAKQGLRAYAAEAATALARERIRRRLTPADQAALIERSIDRISTLHEKSGPR
jgi:F-type H+-transporting ATPase subunit b